MLNCTRIITNMRGFVVIKALRLKFTSLVLITFFGFFAAFSGGEKIMLDQS